MTGPKISEVDGVRIETLTLAGGFIRFRFWVNSFWFKGYGVSDGGLYKSISEAVGAGKEFAKEA